MKVSPLAILLIGLLAVVLFFPNILSQFKIPGIEDLPLSQNTVGVGVTLHFSDGTSETHEPKEHNVLIPLTITYNNKLVEAVEFFARAIIYYSGELDTVWITGTFECENQQEQTIRLDQISYTHTNPEPSDTWFTIASMSVTDAEIEAKTRQGQNAIYGRLEVTEFKTQTREGKIQTFSGSAYSGVIVYIEFDSTVSAVSLEVNAKHLLS